jgi:hypothetical protein
LQGIRVVATGLGIISVLFAASCGGGSSSSGNQKPVTSGFAHRVLAANQFYGSLHVINSQTDQLTIASCPATGFPGCIAAQGTPNMMELAGNAPRAILFDPQTNTMETFNTQDELYVNRVTLDGVAESIAILPNGTRGYAAIRNLSRINVVNLTDQVRLSNIANTAGTNDRNLSQVSRLVMSHSGSRMLAFSDDSRDTVAIVDTSDNSVTTVSGFGTAYTAVFSSDDTKAYVLACGGECGGATARVHVLDMGTRTITGGVNVSGATVGLLDGSTLYVAGNSGAAGKLDIVNTASLTVSTAGIDIADGLHTKMGLSGNGKLFIGSRACTPAVTAGGTVGCLSIVDVASHAVTRGGNFGDVQAIQPIRNRSAVYVIEGGDLHVYNTAVAEPTFTTIAISGALSDMKELD